MADLNGDGWLDIISPNENPANRPNQIFLNDGTGQFPSSIDIPIDDNSKIKLAFGDVDQDGDIDMIFRYVHYAF